MISSKKKGGNHMVSTFGMISDLWNWILGKN